MKLDNSTSAIVTGGASGLGRATARLLAARGVKVALFDLNAEKGEGTFKKTPDRDEFGADINESLIVELYSR